MDNDFLARGYFDDELDFLSKPVYNRMCGRLTETLEHLKPHTKAYGYAVKKLGDAIRGCDDPYQLAKLLYFTHLFIGELEVGYNYFLGAMSSIRLDGLRTKCKFDRHFTSTFLRNYISYMMKLCSSAELYIYCFSTPASAAIADEEDIHFTYSGTFNITRVCWPVLGDLAKLEVVLPDTYPFLLDVYQLVGRNTYALIRTVYDTYAVMRSSQFAFNQAAADSTRAELLELQQKTQEMTCSEFLCSSLSEVPHQPGCVAQIFSDSIQDLMSSQSKHIKRGGLELVWSPN